uniref:Uncharacterized protein n=1 Tax=Lotharella globosa TaxID=91324 RepID=A0A7S3YMP4_9EUKA
MPRMRDDDCVSKEEKRPSCLRLPRWTAPSSFLARAKFLMFVMMVIHKTAVEAQATNDKRSPHEMMSPGGTTLPGSPGISGDFQTAPALLGETSPTPNHDRRVSVSLQNDVGTPLSQVTNDHSTDWNVTYVSENGMSYKLAFNVRNGDHYVLYRNESLKPPTSMYPAAKFFKIPLTSIAVSETVTATFLELLGLQEKIKYMDLTYVTSGCLRALGQTGAIQNFESSFSGSNATLRQLQINDVDAVFDGSFRVSDPKFVSYSATADPGPLHRAEWIEFVSLFFDAELLASSVFNGTAGRYECHRQGAQLETSTKVVAWVDVRTWTTPVEYVIDTTEYKKQFTLDAGGVMYEPAQTVFTDAVAFSNALSTVDVIIDQSYQPNSVLLGDFELKDVCATYGFDPCNEKSSLPFLQTSQIWRVDKLMGPNGLDWFESAIALPDVVVEDLMSIIQPNIQPLHNRTWFRNVATGEAITVEPVDQRCLNATAATMPRVSPADDCPVYYTDRATADIAQDWNVTYYARHKVVWNEKINERYVLYNKDSIPPPQELYPGAKFFAIPIERLAVEQTVAATFLEFFGIRDTIKYMDLTYVTSGCLRVLGEQGNITKFESAFGNTTVRAKQIEDVEAVLTYQASSEPKSIAFSATTDPGPLHRAEWGEFLSLFFNLEKTAADIFAGTVDRYTCHTEQGQLRATSGRKVVAWVSRQTYPEVSYTIDTAAYKRQLIEDAGGIMHAPASTSFATPEAFADAVSGVDVLIDETYFATLPTDIAEVCAIYGFSPCSRDSSLPFLRDAQLWRYDKLSNSPTVAGLDWFESAIAEPDIVLEDLQDILHPDLQPFHNRTWFRNLALAEQVTYEPATCTNSVESRDPRGEGCPYYGAQSTVDFSADWNVTYHAHHKVVWNRKVGERYVLYKRGTEPPFALYPNSKFFEIPIRSVAVATTVAATSLELLGLRETIRYMDLTYVTSGCLRVLGASGDIEKFEFGFGANTTRQRQQINDVDMVLTSSGDASEPKIVAYSSTTDPGPLHRAEWLEFVGLFFDAELTARTLMNETANRYTCHQGQAMSQATTTGKKKVAWVTKRTWTTPPEFVIDAAVYKKALIEDAGGEMLSNTTLVFTSATAFAAELALADVLIDESYEFDLNDATLSKICQTYGLSCTNLEQSPMKFLRNGDVWRLDGLASASAGGGLDWYESAIPEPDAVIADLVSVLMPSVFPVAHSRTWLRNIAVNEPIVIESATCQNTSLPRTPRNGLCPVYQALPPPSVQSNLSVAFTATFASLDLLSMSAADGNSESLSRFIGDFTSVITGYSKATSVEVLSINLGSVVIRSEASFETTDDAQRLNAALVRNPDEIFSGDDSFVASYGTPSISEVSSSVELPPVSQECAKVIESVCPSAGECQEHKDVTCPFLYEKDDEHWCDGGSVCYANGDDGSCCKRDEGLMAGFIVGIIAAFLTVLAFCFCCFRCGSTKGSTATSQQNSAAAGYLSPNAEPERRGSVDGATEPKKGSAVELV